MGLLAVMYHHPASGGRIDEGGKGACGCLAVVSLDKPGNGAGARAMRGVVGLWGLL